MSHHGASESIGSLQACSCMGPCRILLVIAAGKVEDAHSARLVGANPMTSMPHHAFAQSDWPHQMAIYPSPTK